MSNLITLSNSGKMDQVVHDYGESGQIVLNHSGISKTMLKQHLRGLKSQFKDIKSVAIRSSKITIDLKVEEEQSLQTLVALITSYIVGQLERAITTVNRQQSKSKPRSSHQHLRATQQNKAKKGMPFAQFG